MPDLTAHKTTSVELKKNTGVVTTTVCVGRKLTTPLCHTTLWICRFRSGILTIVLTIVLTCRCTQRWWDRTLLYMLEGWPISITLLLSGLISCLSSLVSILFYVPQLLLFNLLHISHQPGYVHVSYQYCNSFLFAWCMTQDNYKLAHPSPDVLTNLRSISRQLGELESMLILTQKVLLQGRKLSYLRPFQLSRKEMPKESLFKTSPTRMWYILISPLFQLIKPSSSNMFHLLCSKLSSFNISNIHHIKNILQFLKFFLHSQWCSNEWNFEDSSSRTHEFLRCHPLLFKLLYAAQLDWSQLGWASLLPL